MYVCMYGNMLWTVMYNQPLVVLPAIPGNRKTGNRCFSSNTRRKHVGYRGVPGYHEKQWVYYLNITGCFDSHHQFLVGKNGGFKQKLNLVGGLEHFLFSHILGIIIPIDFHIFQRGSNHQPGMVVSHLRWEWMDWNHLGSVPTEDGERFGATPSSHSWQFSKPFICRWFPEQSHQKLWLFSWQF